MRSRSSVSTYGYRADVSDTIHFLARSILPLLVVAAPAELAVCGFFPTFFFLVVVFSAGGLRVTTFGLQTFRADLLGNVDAVFGPTVSSSSTFGCTPDATATTAVAAGKIERIFQGENCASPLEISVMSSSTPATTLSWNPPHVHTSMFRTCTKAAMMSAGLDRSSTENSGVADTPEAPLTRRSSEVEGEYLAETTDYPRGKVNRRPNGYTKQTYRPTGVIISSPIDVNAHGAFCPYHAEDRDCDLERLKMAN